MFKNYFKIAFRQLQRNKMYAFINIAGLTVGMTCSFLIASLCIHELNYDRYHEKSNQIYRILQDSPMEKTGAITFSNLSELLKEKYPEIIRANRIYYPDEILLSFKENKFVENKLIYTDANIFEIFTIPLVSGNPNSALVNPNSVVLSETTAKKYFGDEDPLGKTLLLQNETKLIVTGIMKDIPSYSHLNFNFMISYKTLRKTNNPYDYQGFTYVLLPKDYDPVLLEEKMANDKQELTPMFIGGMKHYLEPLGSIYLGTNFQYSFPIVRTGDINNIILFSTIGFLIIIIASINYMNLATAKSFKRSHEVGVRKVLGAKSRQIAFQYYGESLLLTGIAFLLTILLFEILLPVFSNLIGIKFSSDFVYDWKIISAFSGIFIFTAFISGSYPAIFLSRFQPISVLKNLLINKSGSTQFRKGLVIFQFVITIVLIIATGFIYEQLKFVKSKPLGFDKEQIVIIHATGLSIKEKSEHIKSEFLKCPGVIKATASYGTPIRGGMLGSQDIDNEKIFIQYFRVDFDYFETLGIKIAKGRFFSKDMLSDKNAIILNETAVKTFGLKQVIGYEFDTMIGKKGPVIGVVKDFHTGSLHKKIRPTVIILTPEGENTLMVKINPKDIHNTLTYLEKVWHRFYPSLPFEYSFLDEEFNNMYVAEKRLAETFSVFSFISIFIACLGLLGLAMFITEQRTKEIGIRKVIGASVWNIVNMLTKTFAQWVLVANILAWPIAWYAMHKWLQNFAYRIDMRWWMFVLAGGIALVIALLTVIWQAVRAATANPVESLRYE